MKKNIMLLFACISINFYAANPLSLMSDIQPYPSNILTVLPTKHSRQSFKINNAYSTDHHDKVYKISLSPKTREGFRTTLVHVFHKKLGTHIHSLNFETNYDAFDYITHQLFGHQQESCVCS